MRRAMRHAQLLGARDPLMWKLVPALSREMGQAYPELIRAETLVTETLRLEETRFRTTLLRGLSILDEETRTMVRGASLAGDIAFKLYDTFGFPLDLTQDALRPRGIGVDTEGFAKAMQRQRSEARKAWAGSGDAATETVWYGIREQHGATEFLGYDTQQAEGLVQAIVRDGKIAECLEAGQTGWIIVNQTPFYGESGGQAGDSGTIRAPGLTARVTNVQKRLGDVFVHEVSVDHGRLRAGMAVDLQVDRVRRSAIRSNHSATHLLHEALRQVLGDHVAQKGSLVASDRFRFDFSHAMPVTGDELEAAENIANRIILQNAEVTTRLMAQDEAIKSGARALFGEKYGDEVRVVAMGAQSDEPARAFSVELCGGTHAARTGDIGLITIVAESAVASGIRRVEAKTGAAARSHLNLEARRLRDVAGLLRSSVDDVPMRVTALLDDRRKLERDLADARRKLAMGGSGDGASPVREIEGIRYFAQTVEGIDSKDLKSIAEAARDKIAPGVVAIVTVAADSKAGLVVCVSAELAARLNAVDLVRIGAEALGGKGGGGRAEMAQAGGPNGAAAEQALDAIAGAIAARVGLP